MHVLFNILDLAGINSWILYREVTKENLTGREFLFKLPQELSSACVLSIEGPQRTPTVTAERSKMRKTCQIGGCKGPNKTKNGNKCVFGPCSLNVQHTCVRYLDEVSRYD